MYRFFEKRLNPYPDNFDTKLPKNFFKFIWLSLRGAKRYFVATMLLTAIMGIFEAFLFAFMGNIVDWLGHSSRDTFWATEKNHLLLLAAVVLGSAVIMFLQTAIKHQILAGNFPMILRWNFHRLMLQQSLQFYQSEFAGRVSAKILQTALAVREVCMITSDIVVYIVIYFGTILTVVGHFSYWMIIPFTGWLICYLAALYYFIPRLSHVARNQANARSLMAGRVTDSYTNITTVKLFAHAGQEEEYAKSAMKQFMQTVYKQMRMISSVEFTNHLLAMILVVAATGTAIWLWTDDLITVGAVAAVTAMALRLNGIAHWIMWTMTGLFENIGVVQDGINTLSNEPTIKDRPDAKALVVTKGNIDFDHVQFNYDAHDDVIGQLDLHIKAGEKIGLVGRSGAGKSTALSLLLRFYDLNSGKIMIDGQDIAAVTQNSLRQNIGVVTQDTSLLHRSVRDNLMYGNRTATEEEMIEAAKKAQAHDFILSLVDSQGRRGYDAYVGERGVKLSGGQRQRIAIARVILKNAPILLLDEATSALDSEAEEAIQDSLDEVMKGKTVIAIAHRLSTIAAMDRLIVLERGNIIEQGTHHELLEQHGLYAKLWARQSGGFLEE